MGKSLYIVPEIFVTELESDALMLSMSASSSEGGLDGTTQGGDTTGKDADARDRRGSWGDLWEEP